MAFELFDDAGVGLAGMRVWGVRGGDLHLPVQPAFKLYGEYVRQTGESDLTSIDIAADAWYVEPTWQFLTLPWQPRLHYRHARYSGDEAGTADNEEYRGLFFTLGKRDWDTWYQGEINGEFFLFNQNQITHMLKVQAYPDPHSALSVLAYRHALDTPQYFGLPTRGTDWSDEIDLQYEFYPDDRLYGLVGVAWARPRAAARSIFGDDSQLVLELLLSYTLN
jgi:hypothetical protein